MSYEGFVQSLCSKGHLTEYDCCESDPKECRICKSKMVWFNAVDTTNGENAGYIELKLKKQIKCIECSSVLEQTYYIPGRKKR